MITLQELKLLLVRIFLGLNYTIGKLYIDGVYFCDTLEDHNRDLNKDGDLNDPGEGKVRGETCIPFGTYPIILNMSPHFGRELPRLLDVPDFDGILMHRGNVPADTLGCILLGENKVKGKVINSTGYEIELVDRIRKAIKDKKSVSIEIK